MTEQPTPFRGGETEPPTCNCILLCDDVLFSRGKGKHYLQGIVGRIAGTHFPATVGPTVAYIRLSNVIGQQAVTVTFEHAGTGDRIFEFEATLPDRNDPLGVYTIVVPVPPFSVAIPGRYLFVASCNEVPLAVSPIVIESIKPEGGNE